MWLTSFYKQRHWFAPLFTQGDSYNRYATLCVTLLQTEMYKVFSNHTVRTFLVVMTSFSFQPVFLAEVIHTFRIYVVYLACAETMNETHYSQTLLTARGRLFSCMARSAVLRETKLNITSYNEGDFWIGTNDLLKRPRLIWGYCSLCGSMGPVKFICAVLCIFSKQTQNIK